MRLLIAHLGVLDPRSGAAQLCLNLGAALRARGHEVVAFETGVPPPSTPWWRSWLWHRARLERFVLEAPSFDLLDTPAVLLTEAAARRVPALARSAQPDLRYLRVEALEQLRRAGRSPVRSLSSVALTLALRRAVERGWRLARLVMCLGEAESRWLRERRPQLASKIHSYVVAPGPPEQETLASVRRHRRGGASTGCRFLWIGRWSPHKGTDTLLRWIASRFASTSEDTVTIAGCGEGVEARVRQGLPALGARLRILASFERTALPALLEQHDVGLFTSRAEGWGLSLQEMLESGLVVFATREGAVEDLQAFFPRTLRPFPPPPGPIERFTQPLDLDASDYYERFSWPAIARAYEQALLARLQPGQG
jgi:glycosyltransferase involved in cell wall biosynthesis